MYFFRTPFILKKLYPSLVWSRPAKAPVLYLTFDDGPIPEVTPFILDQLRKYDAKATFFCIGNNVRKHPDIFKQILEEGHQVGNHTFNHLNGWKTPAEEYRQNVRECEAYFQTRLFRPPYGRISRSQIDLLKDDYEIIMWDVLSGDFDPALSHDACLRKVLRYARNGSIIVFHDSLKAEKTVKKVLPAALKVWKDRNFHFHAL